MLFRSLIPAAAILALTGASTSNHHSDHKRNDSGSVSPEIMYLQDVSSSFADLKELIPQMRSAFREIQKDYRYARIGFGTFGDRPVKPFGTETSYCYKIQYPLTGDLELLDKPLKNLRFQSGGDEPECQLTALAESGRIQLNRWTDIGHEYKSGEKIVRIALMVTDSSYHVDGDYTEKGFDDLGKLITISRPNYQFEDTMPRVISVHALDAISQELDNVDYPQVAVVKEILEDKDITPLFVITENVLSIYEVLVKELGRGHIAIVSDDLKDLKRVVTQSISHMVKEQIIFECDADGNCPCSSPGGCEADNGDMLIHLDAVPKVLKYSKHEVEDFVNELEFDKLDIVPFDEKNDDKKNQKDEDAWLEQDIPATD